MTAALPDRPAPIPVTNKRIGRNRASGRSEVVGCDSTDGVWSFWHEEDRGTTWTVKHNPTGRVLPFEPSLLAARRGVASGYTLAELDRRDRAEHQAHIAELERELARCRARDRGPVGKQLAEARDAAGSAMERRAPTGQATGSPS